MFEKYRNFKPDDTDWWRVSNEHPCRVCGKPDWCTATGPKGDPEAAICMRIESNNQRPNGGWLHRFHSDQSRLRIRPATSPSNGATANHVPPESTAPVPSQSSCPTAPYEPALVVQSVNEMATQRAVWEYHDSEGRIVGIVTRYDHADGRKVVKPLSPNAQGRWVAKAMPAPRPLYDLHILAKLESGSQVFVVEGEKCAEVIKGLGLVGTTSVGGSKGAKHSDWSALAGLDVVFLPDNDDPGKAYAQDVVELLRAVEPSPSIRIVELQGLAPKGDIADWVAAGGTKEQLLELVEKVPEWKPPVEPWPELVPFEEEPLPFFPILALPSPLREWVEAESIATQTPPDLAALLALAVCAAAVAKRIEVFLNEDWQEPTNIYVAVILEPANRKSNVFRHATRPLREVEGEELEAARADVAVEQAKRRNAQKRLEKLERDHARKPSPAIAAEIDDLVRRLSDWPEPALPRRILDDTTQERLGMILAEQGGRIASMSPEGGVFDLMAGLYSKSGAAQFDTYLKAHCGDPIQTDRVCRAAVSVVKPALTVAYTIQPAVLQNLAEAVFRGRGLLARFLYAVPKSWIGSRDVDPPSVPFGVKEDYGQMVRRLCSSPFEGSLRFEHSATTRRLEWMKECEPRLGRGGDLDTIQDWAGKLSGATVRLAGIMHCVIHSATNPCLIPISLSTMEAAIEIGRYLIPHADRVLSCINEDATAQPATAEALLSWIGRHGNDRFTKRDAHQGNRRKFKSAEALDEPLALLTGRGYIRPVEARTSGPGRPASPEYEVNPQYLEQEKGRSRSQKTHNASSGGHAGHFEDSESASDKPEQNTSLDGAEETFEL